MVREIGSGWAKVKGRAAAGSSARRRATDEEDAARRERLSPEEFHVTQRGGTELAFTGRYWDHAEDGVYHCVVCETPTFDSTTKFDSGSGWPSFYDAVSKSALRLDDDFSLGQNRVEVSCATCDSHMGHVFNDGPPDKTGLRYCINSAALKFRKREAAAAVRAEDVKPAP
jgi:peptide-methionine (R)-S-oxide reductase